MGIKKLKSCFRALSFSHLERRSSSHEAPKLPQRPASTRTQTSNEFDLPAESRPPPAASPLSFSVPCSLPEREREPTPRLRRVRGSFPLLSSDAESVAATELSAETVNPTESSEPSASAVERAELEWADIPSSVPHETNDNDEINFMIGADIPIIRTSVAEEKASPIPVPAITFLPTPPESPDFTRTHLKSIPSHYALHTPPPSPIPSPLPQIKDIKESKPQPAAVPPPAVAPPMAKREPYKHQCHVSGHLFIAPFVPEEPEDFKPPMKCQRCRDALLDQAWQCALLERCGLILCNTCRENVEKERLSGIMALEKQSFEIWEKGGEVEEESLVQKGEDLRIDPAPRRGKAISEAKIETNDEIKSVQEVAIATEVVKEATAETEEELQEIARREAEWKEIERRMNKRARELQRVMGRGVPVEIDDDIAPSQEIGWVHCM